MSPVTTWFHSRWYNRLLYFNVNLFIGLLQSCLTTSGRTNCIATLLSVAETCECICIETQKTGDGLKVFQQHPQTWNRMQRTIVSSFRNIKIILILKSIRMFHVSFQLYKIILVWMTCCRYRLCLFICCGVLNAFGRWMNEWLLFKSICEYLIDFSTLEPKWRPIIIWLFFRFWQSHRAN